jgi:hypothetical protein
LKIIFQEIKMNDTVTPASEKPEIPRDVITHKVAKGTQWVDAEGEVTKDGLHKMMKPEAGTNEASAPIHHYAFPNGHVVHVAQRPGSRFLAVTDFTPNPNTAEGQPPLIGKTSVVKNDIIALAHVRGIAKRPAVTAPAP